MTDEGEELSDLELDRLDKFACEDIGNRDSTIGTIARARTIRRLAAELKCNRARAAAGGAIERAITGGLRAAIHDHGPITADRIGSAVKRIVGNLTRAT